MQKEATAENARRQQAEKDLAILVENSGRSTRTGVAEDIRKFPITVEVGGNSIQISPEERQKRKAVRDRLGLFLSEATAIKQFCLTDPPPAGFSCNDEATKWLQRTNEYITGNLEPSYGARFAAATGLSLSYSAAKTPEIDSIANFLTFKAAVLQEFMKEFRD